MQIKKTRVLTSLALSFGAVVCLIRELELRTPVLFQNFWEDEIRHSFAAIMPHHLLWMLRMISGQLQPALEYFLRKVFWFNLFGFHEMSMRLPGLFYDIGLILFSMIGFYRFFVQEIKNSALAVAIAFVVTGWMINDPMSATTISFARHYSLIALASVVWFFQYFTFDSKKSSYGLLFMASLFFAHAHFFSFFVLVGFCGYEILNALLSRSYRDETKRIAIFLLSVVSSVTVNWFSFAWLTRYPPAGSGQGWAPLSTGFRLAGQMYTELIHTVCAPFGGVIFGIVSLALLVFVRQDKRITKVLFLFFILLPTAFLYMGLKSSYGLHSRYSIVFLGGWVLAIILLLSNIFKLKLLNSNWQRVQNWVVVLLSIIGLGLGSFAHGLVSDFSRIKKPQKDFSPFFLAYQKLKTQKRPIFLINGHCFANEIPLMYMNFMGDGYPYGVQVVSGDPCENPAQESKEKLKWFIENNPKGVLAFDLISGDCSQRCQKGPDLTSVSIEKIPGQNLGCICAVQGVKSDGEVRQIAKILGFDFEVVR